MLRGLAMIGLAGCALGCGNLFSHAGSDGGLTADGGAAVDAGVPPGDGGSGRTDAGGAADSGSPADAGPPDFQWTELVAPSSQGFTCIAGLGSGASVQLWVGSQSASLEYYSNGTWATNPAYKTPSNFAPASVWVSPAGGVYTAGQAFLASCPSGCTQPSAFTSVNIVYGMTGVCGLDDQHVYAVGSDTNSSSEVLYTWNGSQWTLTVTNTGVTQSQACWVASDGTVYISGAGPNPIVRFASGVFTPETVNFPTGWTTTDINTQVFYALWGSGTRLFAAGSRNRIISRNGLGSWDFVLNPSGTGDFHGLWGTSATDAVAGASGGASTNEVIAELSTSGWALDANAPNADVFGVWAASPTEYYLVGNLSGVFTSAIYRGTR